MVNITRTCIATALLFGAGTALAQATAPGVTKVERSTISITNNSAKNITVISGKGKIGATGSIGKIIGAGASIEGEGGVANVNSVNITGGSQIIDSEISIDKNIAEEVTVVGGGTANVNSVNIGR